VQGSYPGCTVTVYIVGTNTLAKLYSDNNGAGAALNNPFSAGADGYWSFYAEDGTYDVRLEGAGLPSGLAYDAVSANDPFFLQLGAGAVERTKTSKLGDVYSVLDYGAKGDGRTDDTAAFKAALNACLPGHTVIIPSTPSNTFIISGAISVPTGCTLQGQGGGLGSGAQFTSSILGTTLKWSGPSATAMVRFHGVAHSALDGVNLDCNNVPGCINLLYDSENNPPSSFNTFRNITFKGFHQAFVAGLTSNTATPSNVCVRDVNQTGCYEADFFTLDNWNTYGNPDDTASEAVHINSANAAQASTIAHFSIQGVNVGIHIVQTNGVLRIQQGNGIGSPRGSNATFVQIDCAAISPDLWELETEGEQAYAVHDSACNFYGGANPTWFADAWFGSASAQVLIDGCDNVTDINHTSNIPLTVRGGSVLAINQKGSIWSPSGTGQLYHWDGRLLTTNNLTVGGVGGNPIVGTLFEGGWASPPLRPLLSSTWTRTLRFRWPLLAKPRNTKISQAIPKPHLPPGSTNCSITNRTASSNTAAAARSPTITDIIARATTSTPPTTTASIPRATPSRTSCRICTAGPAATAICPVNSPLRIRILSNTSSSRRAPPSLIRNAA
jgi:hypothetical protein